MSNEYNSKTALTAGFQKTPALPHCSATYLGRKTLCESIRGFFARLIAISSIGLLSLGVCGTLLSGCPRKHEAISGRTTPKLVTYLDETGSAVYLRKDLIRYAVQASLAAPRQTVVETTTFGSEIPLAPFYTGIVRQPRAYKLAVEKALSKPARGKGSNGAPLLRRIRERLRIAPRPMVVLILSDCGFDDLPEMRKEAELLAKEPNLLGLYALHAVSDNSAYTKLEAALSPLGNKVRLAASADASIAISELQKMLRKGN